LVVDADLVEVLAQLASVQLAHPAQVQLVALLALVQRSL
jgi:hypothetical protein